MAHKLNRGLMYVPSNDPISRIGIMTFPLQAEINKWALADMMSTQNPKMFLTSSLSDGAINVVHHYHQTRGAKSGVHRESTIIQGKTVASFSFIAFFWLIVSFFHCFFSHLFCSLSPANETTVFWTESSTALPLCSILLVRIIHK